jgi:cation transport regulator ChaC
MPLYFAYGSNMASARLRERAASARPLGAARLRGFAWRCNKRSVDGTAKANLVRAPDEETWGVLYELRAQELDALDRAEGGYERVLVEVWQDDRVRPAYTYVSGGAGAAAAPATWYLALVAAGAREHALPLAWIAALERAAECGVPHSTATRSTPSNAGK